MVPTRHAADTARGPSPAKAQKPTAAQLEAARSLTVPDILEPGLAVVFAGINPGLYTAAIGHHFGRPGNRFWKLLHLSGFTPRQLDPSEDVLLLRYRIGATNVVARTTAKATELAQQELRQGAADLASKILTLQPLCLAVLGVGAFRSGFSQPKATVGLQTDTIGNTQVWVLPNPSGLQASYSFAAQLELLQRLRQSVDLS